jgi:hypothetical protein
MMMDRWVHPDVPSDPSSCRADRSGKLARRLIVALIIGVLAGAAIILQVRGWTTLGSEAGGACGTSALVAIGLAGGVLAGQTLFGIWHGTDPDRRLGRPR